MNLPAPDLALDLPYRPCVGIMLIAPKGGVFVGRRRKEAGPEHVDGDLAWQMPQGGIDEGEAPLAAALRELHEETNVSPGSVTLLGESSGLARLRPAAGRAETGLEGPLSRTDAEVVRLRSRWGRRPRST